MNDDDDEVPREGMAMMTRARLRAAGLGYVDVRGALAARLGIKPTARRIDQILAAIRRGLKKYRVRQEASNALGVDISFWTETDEATVRKAAVASAPAFEEVTS